MLWHLKRPVEKTKKYILNIIHKKYYSKSYNIVIIILLCLYHVNQKLTQIFPILYYKLNIDVNSYNIIIRGLCMHDMYKNVFANNCQMDS